VRGPRIWLPAVCCLSAAWLPPPDGPAAPAPLRVEHKVLTRTLTLTGDLEAVEKTTVVSPGLTYQGNHTISYLVPEGSRVKAGDILIQFDSSQLTSRRLEVERGREEARIKVAQTEAEIESRRQDLLLALAGAERAFKNAQLFVNLDPSLLPAADVKRYRYDFERAEIELEKARSRLATLETTGQADLKVARLALEKAELNLKLIDRDLARLTLRATAPGIVMYAEHPARTGKIQVGDTTWRGQTLLEIPDTSRMRVRAWAYDSDYPFLEVGFPAQVVLDAIPDRTWTGRIVELAKTATPRENRSQLRAFQVLVLLDTTDPTVMKPGMTARVRIPVAGPKALVVPRSALGLAADGTPYLVPASAPQHRIPIRILEASELEIAFEGEVTPGQTLSLPTGEAARIPSGPARWLRLERNSYVFSVAGSGIVQARRSVAIGPPPVPNLWQYRIVAMAPEGAEVEPESLLVAFDPTEVQRQLFDEEAWLRKVQEEIERTRATQDLSLKDLEVQLEEARVENEKARNKLVQAREFESDLKVRQAGHEAEFAARRAEILARKLEQVRRQAELQLQILEDRRRLHLHRIQDWRHSLESLQVKAPSRGLVVYETNWRNEKKQIGSSVFRMEQVVSLPDLDSLVIRGQVAEVDAGRIHLGQEVLVSFDALPDKELQGTVQEIADMFRAASPDRPVKVLEVIVGLKPRDIQSLRPGLVARLHLITARFEGVLAVPLTAVEAENDRTFVRVRRGDTAERREVRLGSDNGLLAVVEEGLEAGTEIAARPEQSAR
jgi:HlyD family secretion protein